MTPRTTGRRRRCREQIRSGTGRFLKPADSSCYKCMSVATPEQGHIGAGCQPRTQTHVSMIYLPILFCFLECSQKSQRHHFLSPSHFKQQEKTSTPPWDFHTDGLCRPWDVKAACSIGREPVRNKWVDGSGFLRTRQRSFPEAIHRELLLCPRSLALRKKNKRL